jgi:hypothetical protein
MHAFQHVIDSLKKAPTERDLEVAPDNVVRANYMFWLGIGASFSEQEKKAEENKELIENLDNYTKKLHQMVKDRNLLDDLTRRKLRNIGLIPD